MWLETLIKTRNIFSNMNNYQRMKLEQNQEINTNETGPNVK